MSDTTQQQHDIVEAALGLLASGGPQALRVREIADAAGCTTMTVYSRFGGKDGVVEAIYLDGFTRFAHALREADHGPGLERAHRMGLAYRSWALANPGSYQVMFTEAVPGFSPSEATQGVATDAFQVLIDSVQALQGEDLIRSGDAGEIAWALWGLTHGLVMLELAAMNPPIELNSFEAVYQTAMSAILDGYA